MKLRVRGGKEELYRTLWGGAWGGAGRGAEACGGRGLDWGEGLCKPRAGAGRAGEPQGQREGWGLPRPGGVPAPLATLRAPRPESAPPAGRAPLQGLSLGPFPAKGEVRNANLAFAPGPQEASQSLNCSDVARAGNGGRVVAGIWCEGDFALQSV